MKYNSSSVHYNDDRVYNGRKKSKCIAVLQKCLYPVENLGRIMYNLYLMISISTSPTFRSWVVIFHHRRPMACLSLNLYDTPGLAPRTNVLFWGPGDFPVSYSNRDTLWNAWNRHSGSFMVDTGILLSNME